MQWLLRGERKGWCSASGLLARSHLWIHNLKQIHKHQQTHISSNSVASSSSARRALITGRPVVICIRFRPFVTCIQFLG